MKKTKIALPPLPLLTPPSSHLEGHHAGSLEGVWGQQGGGQAGLGPRHRHQALAVDEEVDEGEGVWTLDTDHRVRQVVQGDGVAVLTPD